MLLGQLLSSLLNRKEGQALAEYAMVLCLILIVVGSVLAVFGHTMIEVFWHIIQSVRDYSIGF